MIANLEPGLHNLSAEVYHADPCVKPSLSSSIANVLLQQSPLHGWLQHPRLNPAFAREVGTDFDRGAAAHAYVLENRDDVITVIDAKDWRTTAAKQARDDARAAGLMPILTHQFAGIKTMKERFMAYISKTELRGIFDDGDAEQSLFWTEGLNWCRARPDLLSADRKIIVDYKTTESAQPEIFARQISRMGYDLQAEFYLRGMNAIGHNPTFIFAVQEVHEPFACSLISLSNAYREVGRLKVERALKIWDRCIFENRWPGYDTQVLYVEPSSWQLIDAEMGI
jgi:PDDEXK-like domain of unknown function (DUF3799)